MPDNGAKRAVIAAAEAYAEACADQEFARAAKPYDNERWSALCSVTQRRLSSLMLAVRGLTSRRTSPCD